MHSKIIIIVYEAAKTLRRRCKKKRNTRGTSSMDCIGERGSHARGVYPTQYTSRRETARVKKEVGADTRIIVKQ